MKKSGLIHPELLNQLARCGHGDKILIADGNYPLAAESGTAERIYLGLSAGCPTVTQVLNVLLQEINVEAAAVMTPEQEPEIFSEFRRELEFSKLEMLSRGQFYEAAKDRKVRIAISTGEQRVYANILLTVGVA